MRYTLAPNKMNILLTGASGFIGRHLSKYLQDKYNVFNIVSKVKGPDIIENRIVLDLRKRTQVKSYFKEFKKRYKIYAVIHLASRMVSGREIKDMSVLYDNLKITESVVEIAELLKPKKIINFSSIAVYPNKDGIYSETSEIRTCVNTECLYGLSKFCSENILDFMLKDKGIVISHLRVSQVYGEGARRDRIIPMMLEELRKKNAITVFGNGERTSNFIEINKLLRFVELFLVKDLKGIYNIGGEHISYRNLARMIIKEHGDRKSKIVMVSKGSKSKFYIDTTRINTIVKGANKVYG